MSNSPAISSKLSDVSRKLTPRHVASALSAAALSWLPLALEAANPDEFLVYNYDHRSDGVLTDAVDIPGRLFVPQQAIDNPAQKFPIVLFFHGVGERGFNNTSQVNGNINNLLANAKALGFFIYAPQLSANVGSWNAGTVDKVMRKLASTSRNFNVDISHAYVTGLSLGGGGVWDSINRYDGGFAAAVSICGVNPGVALDFEGLVNKPIWSFHAANDTTVNVSTSRNRVNNIRTADDLAPLTWPPVYTSGAYFYDFHNQRYTEYQTGGHAIWSRAFGTAELYTWMLSKSLPLASSSLLAGETMYFDVGNTRTVVDSSNNVWNSTASTQWDTEEAILPFCFTSTGRATPVSLNIVEKFSGPAGGVSNAAYGPGIGTDGWQTAANGTSVLSINGLIPGATYTLRIFGSSTSNNRMTRYQVSDAAGVQTQDLNATGNVSAKAEFTSVVADVDGAVDIAVSATPGTTSTIGTINAIELSR